MIEKRSRNEMRQVRHKRLRQTVFGSPERPRLSVFRSLKHIVAQVIDDEAGCTLVAASSVEPSIRKAFGEKTGNAEVAKTVGKLVAERALAKGIKAVVFDRGGHLYHGRVQALADAAREAGLEF